MSDYGFKVSLPGNDANTALPEKFAIHSSYHPPKAKADETPPHLGLLDVDFTATVTQNVVHNLYVINHNYGYIPFSIANILFNDGVQDFYGIGFAGNAGTLVINAYCTTTQFIVDIYDNALWTSNAATLKVSYNIFAENGT